MPPHLPHLDIVPRGPQAICRFSVRVRKGGRFAFPKANLPPFLFLETDNFPYAYGKSQPQAGRYLAAQRNSFAPQVAERSQPGGAVHSALETAISSSRRSERVSALRELRFFLYYLVPLVLVTL